MVPSKSTTNSSRRSSILKPPKPRHPLQNLNFNSSSNESSPTVTAKIKRRVSFAEKKHVKEFCNSLEQGTVWDNTYEEHDLSNLKVPCSSNQKESETESVYKENIFDNIHENNVQFGCNKATNENVDVEEYSSHIANTIEDVNCQNEMLLTEPLVTLHDAVVQETESTFLTDLQLKNDNHISKSIIVYEDPDRNLTEKVSDLSESNVNNFHHNELNTSTSTSVQNIYMDLTEVVPSNMYFGTHYSKDTEEIKDVSMELTTLVLPSSAQNFPQFNKPNVTENLINQDMPMELTGALPSVIKLNNNISNPKAAMCSEDDKTKRFHNVSMEITTVVPPSICNLEPSSNSINYCVSNDKENRTITFRDVSMDITKVVETTVYKSPDKLPMIQEPLQCKYNITRQDERTELLNTSLEMTNVVPVNIHSGKRNHRQHATNLGSPESSIKKLRINSNVYETQANDSKTRICNNESMEFTTAITTLPRIYQNNLQIATQNVPTTQSNSSASTFDNSRSHLLSNKTIIFHDNSVTFTDVLPSLNKRGNMEGKIIVYSESNENDNEGVTTAESQPEDFDTDFTKDRQSALPDSVQNRNLPDFSTCTDNVLKDITATIAIPCLLNSDTTLNKDNFPKSVENNVLEKYTPIKVQSSANITPSMPLHESVQQDTFASALRENNTKIACATFNSVSNDASAVNSELDKDKHSPVKCTQIITSHPRRTYTIQPSNSNHTFTISNKENNISEINNDVLDINNKENNVCSVSNNTECLQNRDYNRECLTDKSDMFFNENVEVLESIPSLPSFNCLDDLTDTDMNVSYNKEVKIEANCLSKNGNNKSTLNLEDCQGIVLEENVRKSCTFLIKRTSLNGAPENSKVEQEDQVQTGEIQKLELPDVRDNSTESQILHLSSSTVNDSEKLSSTPVNEENDQDLRLNNSNLENQSIECSLSNIRAIHESTPKADNDKLIDTHRMEVNNESYSNDKLQLSLEPHTSCKEDVAIELDPFSALMNELKDCAKSNEIIWEVYHENIEKSMFVVGFISCSLLVVIFIRDPCDVINNEFIKEIKLISRLADDADALISIVHRMILEKLDITKLLDLYKNRKDILPMLDYISEEVKLAMDFMFDLKRLNDLNLMEITHDSISFVSQTKTGSIVLEITIDIKPFDKIESQNISVHCLIGSVREKDIKKLIMNVKRDYKFLRRYINDVKDYIYLMDESTV
ncbi:homeobox protein 4-like [Bombus huntii]|uniref:homeobox protein 4-like n=1 Tax=Bombus huntii TaxID=85661 RepID=UPI0021AA175F|nr:homeobox protein 4-like [Bombus huntii]